MGTQLVQTTVALLPSLWLSCGGGAFKTFEDVFLPIRSITTDMSVEAGIPSIENVLSHFAAVVKRRVSGTFQAHFCLLPRCVQDFTIGITSCVLRTWP